MKSNKVGSDILEVEVTNISEHGFWLMVGEEELFLPFSSFPWFRDARISEISDVTPVNRDHLYWEKLDIDLTIDMIQNPDKYPLISNY